MGTKGLLVVVLVVSLVAMVVESCSYVEVKYGGGKEKAIGRSMELPFPAIYIENWKVVTHPARSYKEPIWFSGEEQAESNPIGFVSFDVVIGEEEDVGLIENGEGMNAYGLTVSANVYWETIYQDPAPAEQNKKNVHYNYFTIWALGHFKTTDELIYSLKNEVHVVDADHNPILTGMKYHWGVSDATGNSVVVEYAKGKLHIYDNDNVGVLTNDPAFDWHLWNLNTYASVGPKWANNGEHLQMETPVGMIPSVINKGMNLMGLRGDFTPESRFARMFYLKENMLYNLPPIETQNEATIMTTALMNSVFIPRGSVAADPAEKYVDTFDFTQFTVIKFPHKKEYLFKSYKNQLWKKIQLDNLDLTEGAEELFLPVFDEEIGVEDFTSKLMSSPQPAAQPAELEEEFYFFEDEEPVGSSYNKKKKNDDISGTKDVHVQVNVQKGGEIDVTPPPTRQVEIKTKDEETGQKTKIKGEERGDGGSVKVKGGKQVNVDVMVERKGEGEEGKEKEKEKKEKVVESGEELFYVPVGSSRNKKKKNDDISGTKDVHVQVNVQKGGEVKVKPAPTKQTKYESKKEETGQKTTIKGEERGEGGEVKVKGGKQVNVDVMVERKGDEKENEQFTGTAAEGRRRRKGRVGRGREGEGKVELDASWSLFG